tara:strand:+ start:265 stop:969 length:705 start_codon:yes stop_codon:yes gene_type:complete
MAAACGADFVKLQARDRFEEFTPDELRRPYYGRNSFGKTYGHHRETLDLDNNDFAHIRQRHSYNENPAELFTTVCAVSRIPWLEENNFCQLYKVASKDMQNENLIRELASTRKPLIISTGKARDLHEVENAMNWSDCTQVILMHCVSEYPLPIERCKLSRIETLRKEFGCPVGYSDHSAGVKAPVVAAIKYGAQLIEVHVTSSRAMPGTDHAASLEEPGLRQLCTWLNESRVMI